MATRIQHLQNAATLADTDYIAVDQPAQTGRLTLGDLRDQMGGSISVKQFGAVGDGVTDDTAAVQAAVDAAVAAGVSLHWSAGTYLTTSSINNLHSVRHTGDGVVKRGTDSFAISPTSNQTNILYVSTAGVATNDGLSSSEPTTVLDVFEHIKNYGSNPEGTWKVQLASGTYYGTGFDSVTVQNLNPAIPIQILGADVLGHPNIPTTLVGNPGASRATGWIFDHSNIYVKDIKFQKYDSTTSSIALAGRDKCILECDNVHIATCNIGIGGYKGTKLDVYGGLIDGCEYGILSLFNTSHTIGLDDGTLNNGPVITNCEYGVSLREASSGHVDYVTFNDNTYGLDIQVNARANCDGSDFKNNTVAIRTKAGGNVLLGTANFNSGTIDANTGVYRGQTYGTSSVFSNANSKQIIHRDLTADTHTGSTALTILKSYTLDSDYFNAAPTSVFLGKHIKFKVLGGFTGTNSHIIRVYSDSTNIGGLATTASGKYEFVVDVYFTSATSQRMYSKLIVDNNIVEMSATTLALDFSDGVDKTITIQGQLANAADTIQAEIWDIEVDG